MSLPCVDPPVPHEKYRKFLTGVSKGSWTFMHVYWLRGPGFTSACKIIRPQCSWLITKSTCWIYLTVAQGISKEAQFIFDVDSDFGGLGVDKLEVQEAWDLETLYHCQKFASWSSRSSLESLDFLPFLAGILALYVDSWPTPSYKYEDVDTILMFIWV